MWFFSRDPTKDFPYEIGEAIPCLNESKSIWCVHRGTKKCNGEQVTVFVFELKPGKESQFELAKAAVKRLKTLRHPNVVTFIDSLESEKVLYLVTESVDCLENHLNETTANEKQKSLAICWGLHQIAKGLSFLVNDCKLSHNNICISSIFVDKAGEWKIGGVEFMSSTDSIPMKISELQKYNPPEWNDPGRRQVNNWAADVWGFGCLVWEAYNGPLPKSSSLKSFGKIPKMLQSIYCELVGANPSSRPKPADFISKCKSGGSSAYFNNRFIKSMLFLEEIQIKDDAEKQRYFNNLSTTLDDYPPEICKYKVLPQLINAFEYGNAGSSILAPLFKLSKLLDDDEYQRSIVPCVVKLFSLKDRSTRVKLLQQMETLIEHLNTNTVNDSIFPQVVQGFMDTSPTIREESVKCMLHLASKLNYQNLSVEVMKHFARIQSKDEQGGIRTNTTVCLGKIASYLHPQTRQKILIPAFSRSMRDPFPPARIAGILALSATQCYYTLEDCASKVLPTLACLTIDVERNVRDQAFKTIQGYLSKLEKVSEDPSLKEEMEANVNAGANSGITDTAASWAGWAVSSLTSKFYKTSIKKSASKPEVVSLSTSVEQEKNVAVEDAKKDNSKISSELSRNYDSDNEANDWKDNWGDMETSASGNLSCQQEVQQSSNVSSGDGWDDSGWDSIEATAQNSIGDDADFSPSDPNLTPSSAYEWESSDKPDEFFSSFANPNKVTSAKKPSQNPSSNSSWDNWDEDLRDDSASCKVNRAKEAREQRKLQRQKELQQRRATRQGPMKLGDKQW